MDARLCICVCTHRVRIPHTFYSGKVEHALRNYFIARTHHCTISRAGVCNLDGDTSEECGDTAVYLFSVLVLEGKEVTFIRVKKYFVFLLLNFLVAENLFAQKQGNIWYFGDHAGLDFSSGSPVFLNNGQTYNVSCPQNCHSEGSSVICDSSGALLFYCNGSKIWNRNHQVMPNGDSLLSNPSSTQGSIIVPQPGSSRYFYVFTADDFYLDNLEYGVRYSIVDICLNGGLGDILVNKKNILLLDTTAEKLTAVLHNNGIDYWIIIHKYYSDAFYAYHLTSTGISDTIISHVGSIQPTNPINSGGSIGQLKASPNGEKLAIVNGNSNNCVLEYLNFNNSSGIVSNCVNLQWNPLCNFYGVSFSPDNTKLYVSCDINGNGIYQFDLIAGGGNPDSIRASRTLIAEYYNYLGLQLAVNGKIYSTRSPFCCSTYLGAINYPNNAGTSCSYVDSAVSLNGHVSSYGLPNFIDSYEYTNTINVCEGGENVLTISSQNNFRLFPNPTTNQLTVESTKAINTIEITDALGRVQSFKSKVQSNSTQIDIHSLASGIYLIKLYFSDGAIEVKKFVKE